MTTLTIGLLKEGKIPPDSRVPLTPQQCAQLLETHSPQLRIFVAPSPTRCYTDDEYTTLGVPLSADLSNCEVLMGVKEVPIAELIPNKKYLFFSHTIKKQPYNRKLLQAILSKNIQLIDYETLTWENGDRILGFGHFAGIVGAHNGLMTYGKRTGAFELLPAYQYKSYEEIKQYYTTLKLPPIKIAVTGNGRVSKGIKEVLDLLQIEEVSPADYLIKTYNHPVYTVLLSEHLYRSKETKSYNRADFHQNPQNYESNFAPYTQVTDLMMNGIFWHPAAPVFFSKADMRRADFKIRVIADVTCDINGSVPATLRATKIGDPVMGYDPISEQEIAPYQPQSIDVMSIDNLPNELPRDAAAMFGNFLAQFIIPELLKPHSDIIERATVTKNGKLHGKFEYLQDYVDGIA